MNDTIKQFAAVAGIQDILRERRDFVIAGHVDPDGDAIGACYGMGMALTRLGKKATVILEPYHEKYHVIPGKELLYDGSPGELRPEVLLCLDCAAAPRLGKAETLLKKVEITVCIDHHVSNPGYGQYNYIDADASSTSQLVYHVIEALVPMDQSIASALYGGMVYDTGGFRHGCTGAETLRVAASLMEMGIPFTNIYNELIVRHSLAEARIFSRALARLHVSGHVAYAYVTQADLQACDATTQDVDGIAEYILNVRAVDVAVFFYEKPSGEVKVSFRSKELDVGAIAQKHGGGGHTNASGCVMHTGVEQSVRTILQELIEQG